MIGKKERKLKDWRIAVVGHVTESYGPMQAFPQYLMQKNDCFGMITLPFSYCSIPRAECSLFQKGKRTKVFFGPTYKFKHFFIFQYLSDVLLVFYFFLRLNKKWDIYIGCDCLNAFGGVVLKQLKLVEKVVFYENEYKVRRFENVVLNSIFQFFNGFVARRSDVVWDSPPGLEGLRESQSVKPRRIIRVPHGVDLEKIKLPRETVNRYELVYVGHVMDSKGLQLVVSALEEVVKTVPQVKMTIIGSGPFEMELKKMVDKKRLSDHFAFLGYTDHDWTLSYLPNCAVGIAPYAPLDKQALMHAEPLKVKDYLASGIPVIITRFSEVAEEIEGRKMGVAINYNKEDLINAILKLLSDDSFYKECRKNVLLYDKNRTWKETFNRSFTKTFQILKE